jgi:hypothetical protein
MGDLRKIDGLPIAFSETRGFNQYIGKFGGRGNDLRHFCFPPCRKPFAGIPALIDTPNIGIREMRPPANAHPLHFQVARSMSNGSIGTPCDVAAGIGISPIREIPAVGDERISKLRGTSVL